MKSRQFQRAGFGKVIWVISFRRKSLAFIQTLDPTDDDIDDR